MRRFLVTLLLGGILTIPALAQGQMNSPGSPMNPYIIERNPGSGNMEMRSQWPSQKFNEPGSPMNPYVIERNPLGNMEIHTQWHSQQFNAPGSPTNPYVIERNPGTGNIEIHSRWP
jgi:hypothetical protein